MRKTIPRFLFTERTKRGLEVSYWPLYGKTLFRVISDPATGKVLRRSLTHITLTPAEVAETGCVFLGFWRPRPRRSRLRKH